MSLEDYYKHIETVYGKKALKINKEIVDKYSKEEQGHLLWLFNKVQSYQITVGSYNKRTVIEAMTMILENNGKIAILK